MLLEKINGIEGIYLNYGNGRSIILLEDQLHNWKISCVAEEDQLYWRSFVCWGRSTKLKAIYLEDQRYSGQSTIIMVMGDRLYYQNYGNGRSIILLEDQLYNWKINCVAGEDQLYWRHSTWIMVMEDRLYYWKINYTIERLIVLLQNINCMEESLPKLW